MITHKINGAEISDWDSFHDVFKKLFDFPDYYGRNMDAWNDCMSDLGGEGEIISILLENVTELKKTNLDIFEAWVEVHESDLIAQWNNAQKRIPVRIVG